MSQASPEDPRLVVCGSAAKLPPDVLDKWSNRLARILLDFGARPGMPVAVAVTAPVEAAVVRCAIRKIRATAATSKTAMDCAEVGVATRSTRSGLGDRVRWLVLDDRSTLVRYLTGSDAPLNVDRNAPQRAA